MPYAISARDNDVESARTSLQEVERVIEKLLPALAELCQGVAK